ncbi:MAG TPA: RibD family protein, partial [bacterium]|nr:RibD family protein [bacterium]
GKACNGACFLSDNGVEVEFLDKFASSVEEINRFFFKTVRSNRPWVTAKMAVSKDGYITDAPGKQTLITGHAAKVHVHSLRASHMAVAVGANTVNVDDPLLTVREVAGDDPRPVIFSYGSQIDPDAQILKRDPLIITEPVIEKALLKLWTENKINSVLLEGGANLIRSFILENMIDEFHIITSEKVFGRGVKLFNEETQTLFNSQFILKDEKDLGEDILQIFRKS